MPDPERQTTHRKSYLPASYYLDFIAMVKAMPSLFEIITYRDLKWGDDFDYENSYPFEFERWGEFLKAKRGNSRKIYILLQHDVDTFPARSWKILRQEVDMDASANVMMFNLRVNRRAFEDQNRLEYTEYDVDVDLLREAEQKGSAICYHSNAWDQALFDREKAHGIFEKDVAALRENYQIDFFSAHGGLRSPEGVTNNSLEAPPSLQGNLRWVHNGASPKFAAQWSDGGINSPKRDPDARDLRDFAMKMVPGKRYRILTHPQYYDDQFAPEKCRLWEAEWFRSMSNAYREGRGETVWKEVRSHFKAMRREIVREQIKDFFRPAVRPFLRILKRIR